MQLTTSMVNTNQLLPTGKLEDKRASWFKELKGLFENETHLFFNQVLNARFKQIDELIPDLKYQSSSKKVNSTYYQKIISKECPYLPQGWHTIERQAYQLFDNWAEAWCEYLIWQIKEKYCGTSSMSGSYPKQISINEDNFTDSVIEDISNHEQQYYTLHSDTPMKLSDAVTLINLSTFVKEQQWYEMLGSIELSNAGRHFILTYNSEETTVPTIVSTVRINLYEDAKNWLYFSSFFMSPNWQLVPKRNILAQLGVTHHLLSSPLSLSASDFDTQIWPELSTKHHCCEIIRMTVSGTQNQKMFFLYLSQKRLMKQLHEKNFEIAFVVIEQPFMIKYYESLPTDAYCHISRNTLSDSGFSTYKGLWLIKNLNYELQNSDFRKYKRQTLSQLKQHHKPVLEEHHVQLSI
ncbi:MULTISPECIES: acyl-homoserine-lactone synthase [Vibrio]|uniref:acyl-homoserine-lactone synthase n=1 Tax=Vibrio TaxID=662 RepID=UPI0020750780|nr:MULTISPECIES: acyl-homoserine-lactone synthase [Vibrio]USD33519.1 autoinducer synthase [Vibrio sp. SCSIO 43186]USD46588.1 autoinducer synthase [Vibrio sp. SCSIO 43145]USD70643.1 autoinducer synthase [Vibrio sp. SCSIO 43139]USD95562.1 autoinducer synthase [Vibrio coralliilyticus]